MTKQEVEKYQAMPIKKRVSLLLKENKFQEYMHKARKLKFWGYRPRGGQPKADPSLETITYIYNKSDMGKKTALWLANNFYGTGDYKYGSADVGARVSAKYRF